MDFACFSCVKCNQVLMDSSHLVASKSSHVIFTECDCTVSNTSVLAKKWQNCVGKVLHCKCKEFLGVFIQSACKGFEDELGMYCIELNKLRIYQFTVGYVNQLTMNLPLKKIEHEKITVINPDPKVLYSKVAKMSVKEAKPNKNKFAKSIFDNAPHKGTTASLPNKNAVNKTPSRFTYQDLKNTVSPQLKQSYANAFKPQTTNHAAITNARNIRGPGVRPAAPITSKKTDVIDLTQDDGEFKSFKSKF